MSQWLIAAVGVVYLAIAIDQYIKGNLGIAISFLGYSIGNVGLTIAAK